MAQIRTRETAAQVGDAGTITNNNGPLSNSQIDQNFINLNNDIATRLPLSGGTITGSLSVNGSVSIGNAATTYSIINKPTGFQTALLIGSSSGGLFVTSDNAIISKGAYYTTNTWVATSASGSLIDLTANSSTPSIATFTNATIGQPVSFSASHIILHAGNYSNYALPLSGGDMTGRIRMGTFPPSTVNSGEAWIGRATDRSTGTMTVQLGNDPGRVFEVVDKDWSIVIFNAGMNNFTYKGNNILHAGNYSSYALPVGGKAADTELFDGQDSQYFLRLLTAGTEANIDSYTQNGFRLLSYSGHSRSLLTWDSSGSSGTIQQEFHYNTPTNGWRLRNKTDNTTWSDWGYVALTTANQGHITGTLIHTNNYGTYFNGQYVRAIATLPPYQSWNVTGNQTNVINQINQENFNVGTTGNSEFPASATYKYGLLANLTAGSSQAQIYISHAGNDLIFRGGWGGASWQAWNKVLTDQNYSSYSLPIAGGTLTGELTLNGVNTWFAAASTYLRSNNEFNFLTNSGAAQKARFHGIQVGGSYGGTIPDQGILFSGDTTLIRTDTNTLTASGVLRVVGSNSARPVVINNDVILNGESGSWALRFGFNGKLGTNRGGFGALGTEDTVDYYWIGSAYNSNEFVLRGGKVGIGTSLPGYKLQVESTDAYQAVFKGTDAAGAAGIRTINSGGTAGIVLLTYAPSYAAGTIAGIGQNGSAVIQSGNAPMFVGTDIGISQPLYLATNGTTRAIVTSAGNFEVVNNLTVGGNLTINGTTTTVNSTVTTIDDPIITLGSDTAPTSDDNKDRGIEFRWHNGSAAKVGFFGFDDSTGKFTFIPDATNTSEVFSGTKGTIDAYLDWSNITNNGETLATVTGRGATTSTNVSLLGTGNHFSGHFYLDSYDAAGNHYPHFNDGPNGTGSIVNWRLFTGGNNNTTHVWTPTYTQFNNKLLAPQAVINGGNANSDSDATLLVTATNNNDWGIIVDKNNASATDYGIDIRVGSSSTYALRVISSSEAARITGAGGVLGKAFYDIENTAYWWDPGISGGHRLNTPSGYLDLGPMNAGYCHFQTDRPSFYFNTEIQVNGSIRHYQDTLNRFEPGKLILRGDSPTVYLRDTNAQSAQLHVNADTFYILRGGVDAEGWTQLNSAWPLEINLGTNNALFGGTVRTYSDFRANIYYDINDTNYYVDPAGNSKLNILTTNIYYQASDISIGYLHAEASASIAAGGSNVLGDGVQQDLLAFHPPNTAETWNGSTWSSITIPNTLFAGRLGQAFGGFDLTPTVTRARFTWNNMGYCFWHALNAAHTTQGNNIRFTLETSTDGTTWVNHGTSGWFNSWPGYSTWTTKTNNSTSQPWMRITVERDVVNQNNVNIGCINLMGSYGGFSRLFDWDYQRNVTFYNTVQAVDFNSTSDITKKKDIKTIEGALELIMKLRGVTFNWISTDKPSMGLIAQEVEPVLPQVVHTGEDGTKTISYGNLVGLLVECVKAQEDRLTRLENLILHKA